MSAFLLLLLALVPDASATGAKLPGTAPPQLQDHLEDLDSGDSAKRRLAVRTLRAMVRQDVRRSARRNGDQASVDDALLALQDYDRKVAPRCMENLAQPEVTVPCIDILRLLETTAALPALEQAAETETRGRAQRRLQRTITLLQGYAAEDRP